MIESTILLGGLNAHAGRDASEWNGVNDRHGNADVSDNARLLLQRPTVHRENFFPAQRFAEVHLVQRFVG